LAGNRNLNSLIQREINLKIQKQLGGKSISGAGHAVSCPCKTISRGGSRHQPPLETTFSEAAHGVDRP